MRDEGLGFRRQVGVVLRFPVVLVLGLLWIGLLWWWLAIGGLVLGVAGLVLQPLVYPIAYLFKWLSLAFKNSKAPVLPGYFDKYPDQLLQFCGDAIKLGFPTLEQWLLEGFD